MLTKSLRRGKKIEETICSLIAQEVICISAIYKYMPTESEKHTLCGAVQCGGQRSQNSVRVQRSHADLMITISLQFQFFFFTKHAHTPFDFSQDHFISLRKISKYWHKIVFFNESSTPLIQSRYNRDR